MAAHQATRSARPGDVTPRWFVVDATDLVLGRMASRIATILRGKHQALFTPHADTGDFVIVTNAEKVRLTGRKLEQKRYYRYSGCTGSLRETTAGKLLAGPHADRVVVSGRARDAASQLAGPEDARQAQDLRGANHPHAAQKPQELKFA